MSKLEQILSFVGAGFGAVVVGAEAAVEKGLIKADNPILTKTIGWGAVVSIILQTFASVKQSQTAPVPAPAPAIPTQTPIQTPTGA